MKKFILFLTVLSVCFMFVGCEGDTAVENTDFSMVDNNYQKSDEVLADFNPPGEVKITVFDVGEGDSILINLPSDETLLIDAGPDDSIVDKLKAHNVDKIDYVVISLAQSEHIGGMDAVINEFDVGDVYMPKAAFKTDDMDNLADAIRNKGMKLHEIKAGVDLIDNVDLRAEFVSPISKNYGGNLNNYSAVLYLKYGNRSFVFMGDAEAEAEKDIIENNNLEADFIKVGNHGSYKSTSSELLDLLKPKYAVISVGADNDEGYPNDSVLSLLTDTEVYRTDKNGDITAVSNGLEINITTER